MAPTATDEKLAEKIQGVADTLADFRVEVAERFEKVTERFGVVEKDIAGFRSAVETELRIIRKLGTWLLGGVFGLIAALITGAATFAWSASAVVAEVKQLGQRLDKIESRLEAVEKPLETPAIRPAPKAGG
jgi:tetrahydromethanopterin S-methyltransferase subunit G